METASAPPAAMMAVARLQRSLLQQERPCWRSFSSSSSFYDTLGVSPDASQEDCKKAYLKLAKRYHPDANPDPSSAAKFRAVSEAWETIGDPGKRALHDEISGGAFRPGGGGDGWAKQKRDARRNAWASDARRLTQLERLMGPKGLGLVAVLLAGALFFTSGPRTAPSDETLVKDCWVNPATRRLEPPAPWDPNFKKAKAAGQTRTLKRSDLG